MILPDLILHYELQIQEKDKQYAPLDNSNVTKRLFCYIRNSRSKAHKLEYFQEKLKVIKET